MKECFQTKNFTVDVRLRIQQANEIIAEYMADGYKLTLRQLYYQFVARGIIPNNMREYKKLGSVINDGRLAGKIDWDAIEDRTRELSRLNFWDSPKDILAAVAQQFRYDAWETQPVRIEVWVEKEALVGVIERICNEWQMPFFACRGYVSQSEQYGASKRFLAYVNSGQKILVLHMGDHDPSGIDMTRDNEDRIRMFLGEHAHNFNLKRIALNEAQVEKYSPPPNPAKLTDSRATKYIERFGDESWELDALDPKVIHALIKKEIDTTLDADLWDDAMARQARARKRLGKLSKEWED